MHNQIKAVILDDETLLIEGRKLVEKEDIAEAIRAVLQRDPDVVLVIAPVSISFYKGIGKVLYTSQRVGVPVENLRYMTEEGKVVTFDELQAHVP